MNELLGWYGYGNVDRNELTRTTVSESTQNHRSDQSKLMHALRTTNSTPSDRLNDNSSPESSTTSKETSIVLKKISENDNQGLYVSLSCL